jgi:hypothetical protein
MMRKTVFAIAVAGACAWPVATLAGHEVRTPMSDSEVGPNPMRHEYSVRPYIGSDEGRYEVQTPLSVSEVGPMVNWNSYWGWYDPAPDSVRLSHGIVVDRYGHPVGASRGEPETYYVVPRR